MKELIWNATTIFHLLRHFQEVSDDIKDQLLGKQHYYFDYGSDSFQTSVIQEGDIVHGVQCIGTKFSSDISMTDVMDTLKQQYESQKAVIQWAQDGWVFRASMIISYPSSVGWANTLNIDHLEPELCSQVVEGPRSELAGDETNIIRYVKDYRDELPSTNDIKVELVSVPELDFLWVTAYPAGGAEDIEWEKIVFAMRE